MGETRVTRQTESRVARPWGRWIFLWVAGAVLAGSAPVVTAAQFVSFPGGYEVHYIVVTSTFIEPEVATRLGITRGSKQALVNLSVLKDGVPVSAAVTGTATNLIGTLRPLEFREVREGVAIYSIAVLRFSEQEHWRFAIDIDIPGRDTPAELRFTQQLFVR